MPKYQHEAGCVLDPVNWLRHAIAACQLAQADPEDSGVDRLSAMSLLNSLEMFTERADWRTATLADAADFADLVGQKFSEMCTCGGPRPSDGPSSTLKW